MIFHDEVVPADDLDDVPSAKDLKTSDRELKMAQQLIDSLSSDFEPPKYHDEYREKVLELIEAQGRRPGDRHPAGRRGAAEGARPDGRARGEPRRGQGPAPASRSKTTARRTARRSPRRQEVLLARQSRREEVTPARTGKTPPHVSPAAPRRLLSPGLTRRKHGKGFTYLDADGERVTDPEDLERIAELGIPPAWKDVWICPDSRGHLQATGIDAAGRKQYLYHPQWRTRRDSEKFDEMLRFAAALPKLREHVDEQLTATDELTRERVLACAVRLLDRGFFRVGSEQYAAENESYGLATMRKEHVTLDPEHYGMVFDYKAKSGKRRIQGVVDPAAFDVVAALKRRRGGGPELLAYKNGRSWSDVRSPDINEYLKEATGDDFSAKDFRTWAATMLAAIALSVSGEVAATKTGHASAP